MLSMVFLGVPAFFGSLLWFSYRRERKRLAAGEAAFATPGRERW